MIPFCNNLRKGDEVEHAVSKRRGVVDSNPRETSAQVQIVYDGTHSCRYVPIMDLRLLVDGKPEEVPPCDGLPNDERVRRRMTVPPSASTAVPVPAGPPEVRRQLRDQIWKLISRYNLANEATCYHVVGILEAVKSDCFDTLQSVKKPA